MPVKSLNLSILKWPNKQVIEKALQKWIKSIFPKKLKIIQVGYFGSYARGDWGVGSDLDLLIVLENSNLPFEKRAGQLNLSVLPVPVDALIYTRKEWEQIKYKTPFGKKIARELVYLI